MNTISKPLTLKRWVLLTTYGWFIGILLIVGFALVAELLLHMNDDSGGQAIVGMGMGAGIGLMQWMALRKHLASSSRLFLYSLAGFSIAFILRDLIAARIPVPITVEITIPFAVLLGAWISSWLQHAFIFKKIFGNSINWIYHSIIGWLLATLVTMGTSVLNFHAAGSFPKVFVVLFSLIFLSIGGPILGYITGRFIVPRINAFQTQPSPIASPQNASNQAEGM